MSVAMSWLKVTMTALAALAVMSCGGGDDDGDENGSSVECTPVAGGDAEIDQDALKFVPSTLCVKAGQPVLFKNSETALHTVHIEGKNESGTMKKGDEFRWTPAAAGTFNITCEFHPQMKARITVVS